MIDPKEQYIQTVARPIVRLLWGLHTKDLVGAEMGVFQGDLSYDILQYLPIKKLYLVDPYLEYSEQQEDKKWLTLNSNPKEAEQIKQMAAKRLSGFKNIEWIYKLSVDAAKDIPDNSLNFVYLDGNHEYDFIKNDIEIWTAKVKPGWLVAGHDGNLPSVYQALEEYIKLHPVHIYQGLGAGNHAPDWWFIKDDK